VLVEFAIVFPVLLLMILASIEFGRAMMVCNVLTTAAREGARGGVLPTATNTEITAAVNSQLTANSVSTGDATIQILVNDVVENVSEAGTGDRIRVQVTVDYGDVTWLPSPRFLATAQLRGIAVMRRE